MLRGAIVPHAPVLVPAVAGRRSADLEPIVRAVAHVGAGMHAEDTVVLLTPHGREPGILRRIKGSLGPQGIPDEEASAHGDEALSDELARSTGLPVILTKADHGLVVPLLLGVAGTAAVVGITVDSDTSDVLAASLRDLPGRVAVVASAHLGAGLDPSAPLTLLPGAPELESEVLEEASRDCAVFKDRSHELRDTGGSCSSEVLTLFGDLFSGRPLKIHHYDRPFGVGYLVGSVA